MTLPFKKIKSLSIEKIVFKGFGIAYFENYTIMIEHTVPGDLVDVEILYSKKTTLFAKVIKYLKRSPLIKLNRCPVSGICGGCNWVNIRYEEQLAIKNLILQDIYKPIIDKIPPLNISPSPKIDHYRNKTFQPVQLINKAIQSGIYAKNSHEVIPHQHCYIHPPIFDEIIAEVIEYAKKANVNIYNEDDHSGCLKHIGIRQSSLNGNIIVILVTKNKKLPFTKTLVHMLTNKFSNITGIIQNTQSEFTNVILGNEDKILFGNPILLDNLGKVTFEIHYQAFFQVNKSQTEKIYSYIKSQIGHSKYIIDAYSGIGSIGLFLSDENNHVSFIEENPYAHLNAQKNAQMNQIKNTSFYCGKTEDILPKLTQSNQFDSIVFDPPRKGLDSSIIFLLEKLSIPQIIYMSCNPSTQLRDLILFEKNGYKIQNIQPFDMFPHTWHIETVAVLKKH